MRVLTVWKPVILSAVEITVSFVIGKGIVLTVWKPVILSAAEITVSFVIGKGIILTVWKPVILSAAKNLSVSHGEILRCAQNDRLGMASFKKPAYATIMLKNRIRERETS